MCDIIRSIGMFIANMQDFQIQGLLVAAPAIVMAAIAMKMDL